MSQDLHELEQRMSQLDDADKAHLLLFLLGSFESADSENVDEAWRMEAEARMEAIEREDAHAVPADEVFANLSLRFR